MNWYIRHVVFGSVGFLLLMGFSVLAEDDDLLAPQVQVSEKDQWIVPDVSNSVLRINAASGAEPQIVTSPSDELDLSTVATNALSLNEEWKNVEAPPFLGKNGRVIYQYGATLFPIVGAPGNITDIVFEPDEVFLRGAIRIGDSINWIIDAFQQTMENGDVISHLVLKPVLANIKTTMVVATNRRSYYLSLESTEDRFMTSVGFHYPNDTTGSWSKYFADVARATQKDNELKEILAVQSIQVPNISGLGHSDELTSRVDFGFVVSGDNPVWRPVRVYALKGKTYIELPKATNFTKMPAFFELSETNKKLIVNSRYIHNTVIVDKLIKHGVLISGARRSSIKVEIKYIGDK